MPVGTETFGKSEVQFSDKIELQLFPKSRQTRCSEVPADAPRVLCGIFCRFAVSCTERVKQFGGAARGNDEDVGENEELRASLYYLCWILREH